MLQQQQSPGAVPGVEALQTAAATISSQPSEGVQHLGLANQGSGEPNASESNVTTPTAESVPSHTKAKRTGLVKPNRAPPGARSAETAIPAAGYGAQHRQIDSDLAKQQSTTRAVPSHHSNASASPQSGPGPTSGQLAPAPPAMAPSISVGQVVDPRTLGAHSGYHVPPPAQSGTGSGRLPPGAAPPISSSSRSAPSNNQATPSSAGGSSTSPTLAAERMRGKQTPSTGSAAPDPRSASSGAWLASGGEPRRRGPSPVGDEHAWLGSGVAGTLDPSTSPTRPRSKSPQPDRTSDPVHQAWRSEEHEWDKGGTSRQRASEPRDLGSEYTGPGHRHDARSLDAGSGDSRFRKTSQGADGRPVNSFATNQPTSRPPTSGSDTSSYTSAQSGRSSPNQTFSLEGTTPRSKMSGSSRGMPPIHAASSHLQSTGPAVSLPGGSAMLEAARTSQSRRR